MVLTGLYALVMLGVITALNLQVGLRETVECTLPHEMFVLHVEYSLLAAHGVLSRCGPYLES